MTLTCGRCLCGAITFTVAGALRDVVDCHCTRCRRFTGHHLAATAAEVNRVAIEDVGGQLRWYYPVPEAGYGFCGTCGSSLFWRAASSPEVISVCAGSLDGPTNLSTARAWWTIEAGDYYQRPDVPEHETEG